eukprot:TRINITY_DN11311_c0_g1_i2.p1 TRINITY_DN11311_c0_g1~~TRINITY_DN11311_c0_g1_i2.p1  ORF type:complete len:390 (-),score=120.07 TRINITY_DN11311_c0_g1_i2:275-1444(-)
MSKGVARENIKTAIFGAMGNNEKVTRDSFISIITNGPLSLTKESATLIAVHCINKKETIKGAVSKLSALIPDYTVPGSTKKNSKKKAASKKEENKAKQNAPHAVQAFYTNTKINGNDSKEEKAQSIEGNSDQLESVSKGDSEEISIDEEKIIKIAQDFFSKLAKKLLETKTTLAELYAEKLKKVKIGKNTVEVLSPEDFFVGLKQFQINVSDPIEYACLIKILAVNDDEKLIKFEYLTEILNDYTQEFGDGLDFSSIDDISLVIILMLSEHLVKEEKSLESFLGDKVYTQSVQIDSHRGSTELIDSKDFFKLIEGIGVTFEDKEHENLKEFLAIDISYKDKLSVPKIERAVNEFIKNESLQKKAVKYYEAMVKASKEEGCHDYYKYTFA